MKKPKQYPGGLVKQWRARDTHHLVGLYHSEQSGIESDPELPWSTVCEAHHTLVSHSTMAAARACRSGSEFCDECRAEIDPVAKTEDSQPLGYMQGRRGF